MEDLEVLMVGAGAAGVAVAKILMDAGVTSIVACDRFGAIHTGRDDYQAGSMNAPKRWLAENTNTGARDGQPREVIEGTDVFIGLSGPGIIDAHDLQKMNPDPFVFAMANPNPEVPPEEAAPYVRVMATGRSDYPNQINNVLAFPGIFRGAFDVRATAITEDMKLAAARGIASVVADEELDEDYIIPSVFNRDVARRVAEAVAEVAERGDDEREAEQPTVERAAVTTPSPRPLMRVAVTGATGLIGHAVVVALAARGDEVTELSRSTNWPHPKAAGPPSDVIQRRDAVVHLLGEPIAQRWSDNAKREIRESRILSTRNLVTALGELPEAERPGALISGSGAGWYGHRGDERLDESAPAGDDFLAGLSVEWEAEARRAEELGMRVVLNRTGVVLSPSGGALAKMLPFFKAGVGGPVAGGRQYVPWIHLDDVVGAILFELDTPAASGPINLTAPEPATNRELSEALGRALRRPAVAPVPALAVRTLYGQMAEIVITGQRAVPARLTELGYGFKQRDLEAALRDATGR